MRERWSSVWQRREQWLPVVLMLALSGAYFLSFFNRFVGLRSGDGEFGGGMAFLNGQMPYRDYYTAGPPLNAIKAALELAVFGKLLIVTRVFAVIERLLIAWLLYAWLRKLFSRESSAVAAFATIVLSAGDHTDPLASYNHDAILFAMVAGFLASYAIGRTDHDWMAVLGLASGVAAALSSLTKQTVGLGCAIVIFAVTMAAVWRIQSGRAALRWGVGYIFGFGMPIAGMGGYLWHAGVLRACLTMLFISGPAAKASAPHAFLLREWSVASANPEWILPAVAGVILCAGIVWRGFARRRKEAIKGRWMILAVCGAFVIALGEGVARWTNFAVYDTSKFVAYFALLGAIGWCVVAIVQGVRRGAMGIRMWQVALFAAVSSASAATLSLSWPIFEAMILPGLGLLFAAGLDGAGPRARRVLYLASAMLVFFSVWEKSNLPFSFGHENEPQTRLAVDRSEQPMLRGMRFSAAEVRLLDETTRAMRNATASGETVFTYPEMGLLYSLSGARYPTWSGSHNIDVISDVFARQEAARLLATKPAVVLYAHPSEANLRSEEMIWRGGNRSGQRDIVDALDTIVSHYRLQDSFVLREGDPVIRLYVK